MIKRIDVLPCLVASDLRPTVTQIQHFAVRMGIGLKKRLTKCRREKGNPRSFVSAPEASHWTFEHALYPAQLIGFNVLAANAVRTGVKSATLKSIKNKRSWLTLGPLGSSIRIGMAAKRFRSMTAARVWLSAVEAQGISSLDLDAALLDRPELFSTTRLSEQVYP